MGEVRPLASEEVDTLRRAGEAGQLLLAPSPLATSREGSSPPLPLSCPVAAAPRAAAAGKSTLLGIGAATTAAVESLAAGPPVAARCSDWEDGPAQDPLPRPRLDDRAEASGESREMDASRK